MNFGSDFFYEKIIQIDVREKMIIDFCFLLSFASLRSRRTLPKGKELKKFIRLDNRVRRLSIRLKTFPRIFTERDIDDV